MMALLESRRQRPVRLVERNAVIARRNWAPFLAGAIEPFLFLFSIGLGVGSLVDAVELSSGELVDYQTFVAPGLLASSAMNTAVFATTFDFFVKLRYLHTYDAVLATPLSPRDVVVGELIWSLARATIYAFAFVVTMAAMGLIESPLGVLILPAAVLIALGFSGVGLAVTTWMRSWLDFDLVNLALVPLFLFSATFFPLDQYPSGVAWVVRVTPLYHGVDLIRSLALGDLEPRLLISVGYLAALGAGGVAVAMRRLALVTQP